jgi:hypothetical protein
MLIAFSYQCGTPNERSEHVPLCYEIGRPALAAFSAPEIRVVGLYTPPRGGDTPQTGKPDFDGRDRKLLSRNRIQELLNTVRPLLPPQGAVKADSVGLRRIAPTVRPEVDSDFEGGFECSVA